MPMPSTRGGDRHHDQRSTRRRGESARVRAAAARRRLEHRREPALERRGLALLERRGRPSRRRSRARRAPPAATIIEGGDSCRWCSASWREPRRAAEREHVEAEHVERGEHRADQAQRARCRSARTANALEQDLVLAEEAGERRHAGDRQRRDQQRAVRPRQLRARARPSCACPARPTCAWITEPAPRNSSALKNACVMRWKMPARERADAARHEHVAELAHRGVRQHALDVVLREADGRREQRGRGADHRDHLERERARAGTARGSAPPCRRRR